MADIFGQDNPVVTAVRAEDLVGEGKKFKDVDALAAGKAESDRFIEQLKAEKAEADRRAAAAANAEAELQRLREEFETLKKAQEQVKPPLQPGQPATQDIEKIVLETITRTEKLKTETQNINEANKVMTSHYGDPTKAGVAVGKRAEELGLSVEDLRGIAARSPSAFKRIMLGDAEIVEATPVLNRSTTAVVATQVGGQKAGTKEFYQELLRTNPKRYFDPSTQRQIVKDMELGNYVP